MYLLMISEVFFLKLNKMLKYFLDYELLLGNWRISDLQIKTELIKSIIIELKLNTTPRLLVTSGMITKQQKKYSS